MDHHCYFHNIPYKTCKGDNKLQSVIKGLLATNPTHYQEQTEITNDSLKNNEKH